MMSAYKLRCSEILSQYMSICKSVQKTAWMTPVCIQSLSAVRNNSLATVCGVFNLQGYIFIILNLGVKKNKIKNCLSELALSTNIPISVQQSPIHPMCINIQPVTTIYTIQLAIAIPQPQYSLAHLLYVPHSAPFSQISTTWTLYWGISRTHPLIPHTYTLPHQLESIQTGIVLSPVPTSLVKKKNWVQCIHQDGRPYSNPSRVRWHSTFKAEMLYH